MAQYKKSPTAILINDFVQKPKTDENVKLWQKISMGYLTAQRGGFGEKQHKIFGKCKIEPNIKRTYENSRVKLGDCYIDFTITDIKKLCVENKLKKKTFKTKQEAWHYLIKNF